MKRYKYCILMIVFTMLLPFSYGQDEEITSVEDTLTVYRDIFELDAPMIFELEFDIKKYQKTKFDGNKMPAVLTYHITDSVSQTKNIRIQARGAFRRQHCHLPPFWINIKKAGIENQALQTTNKLKLVNHCNGAKTYNNYVLREYLTYKLYNLLSPYSFRVALVKIKYIDTGRKGKVTEGWAFMIEPEKMMAERLNAFPLKNDKISQTLVDTVGMDRVAIFQYMIGNCDYSIAGRHNVKLIKIQDVNKFHPIPVPYDFDYSGLVNTYYAIPGEDLGLNSVRERYFLGVCRSEERFEEALKLFNDKRAEIVQEINDFEFLSKAEKTDMINYIEGFYAALENDSFIDKEFHSTCR